jgi:NAD(P)-dependent dehydrogenase (short-subunit alcohol dehydrogenase family)
MPTRTGSTLKRLMAPLVAREEPVRFPPEFMRYMFRSPRSPARAARLLRAPSLTEAVHGRVVLVTGASSGIGRATALRLGAAGAKVLLAARRLEELEDVAAAIAAGGGSAFALQCDLRDMEAVDRLAAEVLDRHGRVDVLINNAGRSIRRSVAESYERAHDYERTMRLNYFASVRLILALLPGMVERRSGQIINVSTMGVYGRAPRWSAYIASKSALEAFSNVLAVEARPANVAVTNIHFPLVHTPMSAPTAIYDGAPGLTAEEAADTIAEAIRTRPPRLTPRLGLVFGTGWLVAPTAMNRLLSSIYQRSLERSELVERLDARRHVLVPRRAGDRVAPFD